MSSSLSAETRLSTTEACFSGKTFDAKWFRRCAHCGGKTALCQPCRRTSVWVCPNRCPGDPGFDLLSNSDFESSTDVTSAAWSCATQVTAGTSGAPMLGTPVVDASYWYDGGSHSSGQHELDEETIRGERKTIW